MGGLIIMFGRVGRTVGFGFGSRGGRGVAGFTTIGGCETGGRGRTVGRGKLPGLDGFGFVGVGLAFGGTRLGGRVTIFGRGRVGGVEIICGRTSSVVPKFELCGRRMGVRRSDEDAAGGFVAWVGRRRIVGEVVADELKLDWPEGALAIVRRTRGAASSTDASAKNAIKSAVRRARSFRKVVVINLPLL